MSQSSVQEIAVLEPAAHSGPDTKPANDPARKPFNSKAAIRRCMAAFEDAYAEFMNVPEENISESLAVDEAGKAYCNAMPILDGYKGIREFMACAAHGILIGAIAPEMRGHLLYAAQVALSIAQKEPKPPQPRPK